MANQSAREMLSRLPVRMADGGSVASANQSVLDFINSNPNASLEAIATKINTTGADLGFLADSLGIPRDVANQAYAEAMATNNALLAAEERILGEIAADPSSWDPAKAYNAILESGVTIEDALDAGVKQSTIDAIFTSGAPLPVTAFSTPSTVQSAFESPIYSGQSMEQIRTGAQNYVAGLMADGVIDENERRELQAIATEQGATFQDILAAGVDPSILFNVPAPKEPMPKEPMPEATPVGSAQFPQTQPEYVPPTVYQPLPDNTSVFAPGEPSLDVAFRESAPRTEVTEDVMGTQQLTGFDYAPAASLISATGSGFSWTPPTVTSRPRSLMSTGTLGRYTQGRAAQDLRQLVGNQTIDGVTPQQRYESFEGLLGNTGSYGGGLSRSQLFALMQQQADQRGQQEAANYQQFGTRFGARPAGTTGYSEIGDAVDLAFDKEGPKMTAINDPMTVKPVDFRYGRSYAEGGEVKKLKGFADGGPADLTPEELQAQLVALDSPSSAAVREPNTEDQAARTESRSMLDRLNTAFSENISKPVVGSLLDMTVGLGDLAQLGVKKGAEALGIETKPFVPVSQRLQQSAGVAGYDPYSPAAVTTQILPFARARQAGTVAATQLEKLFPSLGRETAAYGGSEIAAAGAREIAPDSMAAELLASTVGGIGGDIGSTAATRRMADDVPPDLPDTESARMLDDIEQAANVVRPTITEAIGDRKRVGTTGKYVGAPEGVDTPQKLAALTRSMTNLTKEGEFGRFWYERSGRQILDLTGGSKEDAEKIVQAIAITSANTPVAANFDYALQAYYQWKNGQPIKTGMYTTAMSNKLQKMFDGEDWAGRKTNNFYNNLMREIDPSKVQGVTTDIWMMRAFGFGKDAPTDAQYSFVENETKRIAQNLGWEPQQVQAAIWVALKSRMENDGVKKAVEEKSIKNGWMHYEEQNGKKVRVIDDQAKHAANWLETAMKYSPTEADKTAAGFDYADAAERNLAQISWESIPSRTSGHMPEIFEAPPEVVQDYHTQMSKAFLDDDGNDIIAKHFNVLSPGDFEAPGYFEELVSPGTQTQITVPRQYGVTNRLSEIRKQAKEEGWPKDKLDAALREVTYATEPAARDLMLAYAAARGILLKQDGVGLHRPAFISNISRPKANGVEIDIGRPFTRRETAEIARLVAEEAGHTEYNPIGSPNGVRFINFDYLEAPNLDFQNLIARALNKADFDNNEEYTARMFGADTDYLGNNWQENFNGEGYLDASNLSGRPDLQRQIRDIVTQLTPRISAVEEEFANKYGWTRNTSLNNYGEQAEGIASLPVRDGVGQAGTNKRGKVTFASFGGSLGDARQKLGITPEKIKQFKDSSQGVKQTRVPEVEDAAKKLNAGEISTQEYLQTVEKFQPITPLNTVQKRPTNEEIAMALTKNEADSAGIVGVNLDIPDGTMISSRLDIPAYESNDTWVVTLHDGSIKQGLAVGYGQTAVLNGVEFVSNPNHAVKIAAGDSNKGTIARINGSWENRDPDDVEKLAKDILNGTAPDADQWTEVGMNPFRHSYFYRKSDGMPVANAEQVIQIGPLVLAKKVKTRPVESPEHEIKTPKGARYFKHGGNVERMTNDNRKYI